MTRKPDVSSATANEGAEIKRGPYLPWSGGDSCSAPSPASHVRSLDRSVADVELSVTRVAETTRVGLPADDAPLSAWWRRQRERSHTSTEVLGRLSEELEVFAQSMIPSEDHLVQQRKFLQRFQHLLCQIIDVEVSPFGSSVTGFWTVHSDLDICVRTPGATTRTSQLQTLRKIHAGLTQIQTHVVETRYGAQVPIIHWAPLKGGIACDISVNNVLAVVNSLLVGQYVKLDRRLRTLGLCLKTWAQARGINDRSRGTLSSFALTLMLINFLQCRTVPILPSLQDIAWSRNESPKFVAGIDCRYCTDQDQISEELRYLQKGRPANQECVGQLLLDFFFHYGHKYNSGVIRIRDTRSLLPPVDESSCYLVVDNPFEAGKDVANVDVSQHATLRKEFRRAWSMLSHGRSFREVVQSGAAGGRWQKAAWC